MSDHPGHGLIHQLYYATMALTGMAVAGVTVYSLWNRQSLTAEASRDDSRIANALRKLGRSDAEFNDHERILLAEVVFPGNKKRRRRSHCVLSPSLHTVAHCVLEDVGVMFKDVGGLEKEKQSLREAVILPMKNPEKYSSKLLQSPKGVLLYGPPGNGKTLLARAVAGECSGCFINLQPSAVFFKYVGESQRLAKAFFTLARKLAPAVIFIDEIDCLFSKGSSFGEHPSEAQVRSILLTEWDGLSSDNSRIIVIAATNNPMLLDTAVHRRLPRQFEMKLPDLEQRKAVLAVCLEGELYGEGVLDRVANATERYCASDLMELCKGAATVRLRDPQSDGKPLNWQHFRTAMEFVKHAGASAEGQVADLMMRRK